MSEAFLATSVSAVGNHLWQTTLFAGSAGLLTLALRKNGARVRYRVWLVASLKFLLPFSLLVAGGSHLGWRSSASIVQPDVALIVEAASQPFSGPALSVVAPAPATAASSVATAAPFALLIVWACGCAVMLLAWWVRWRRVAAIVRTASPLRIGREVDAVRRLEAIAGVRRPIALVATDASMEPGVFGIVRPVLLWPRTLTSHLDAAQVEAILAHEVAHVRRRDNLAAATHMLVQAIFWFHPLVWWLGMKLLHERERACDEDVIRLGSEPAVYAESILETCRRCVASPLTCVAGVTGSSLTRRIQHIMRPDGVAPLGSAKALLLATAAALSLLTPLATGMLVASQVPARVSPPDATQPTFDVASVKVNKSGESRIAAQMQPGGRFTATNISLRFLIRNAFQVQDDQISGEPKWLNTDRFDIVAKTGGNASPDQLSAMMRALLADRFKLVTHRETRELSIYALVLARSDGALGPQFRRSDCAAERNAPVQGSTDSIKQQPCGTIKTGLGRLTFRGVLMSQVLQGLSDAVHRTVADRTALSGRFDLDLQWTPETAAEGPSAAANVAVVGSDSPSIFTALQEQLGLKLDSQRGPVDVVVIDSVDEPTPD